ncbi:MAG TPA: helix-turn-helix domain-containing protein [Vicinamibacterales bacterium]|nr:helix-turn-helix domain-containing protein [Vicinamibacterales bacterium]
MPAGGDAHIDGESFGTRLRRERERHDIALRSIADNTKISLALLKDLERDDASRWPSGIFRRSFFRAYAQAISVVDVEAAVREFLDRFPDPNDPQRAAPDLPARPTQAAHPAPTGSVLHVKLAETGWSFVHGWVLPSTRSRFVAIACDAVVVLTVALAMYLVVGRLWMPLCLTLAGYYVGGILLLGNTPGVCLCAPAALRKEMDTAA